MMRFFIKMVKAHSSFSTDSSKVAPLLQFVYASMVSYVTFALSLFFLISPSFEV